MFKRHWFFLVFFSLYTAFVILILALGLGAAVAAYIPFLSGQLEALGTGEDLSAVLARTMLRAAPLSLDGWRVGIDYALSALNLACGILLVRRRPWDWVARLLGLGMVGVAMAYNTQSHGVLAVASVSAPLLRPLVIYHYILHAVSGAVYVHALVLFPDGKLVSRRLGWFLGVMYLIMTQEIVFPILKGAFGASLFPAVAVFSNDPFTRFFQALFSPRGGGLAVTYANLQFAITSPANDFAAILRSETLFFILLFGLLIPIVGVTSLVNRYRTVLNPQEREQSKLVVWSLAVAFGAELLLILVVFASNLPSGAGAWLQSLKQLEDLSAEVFPVLFAVIPLALIIAILRYRLFDIDVVINRTLVYGPLTAILAGLFAALVRIVQSLFIAVTGERSDIAIIITTLVVTAAFQPIRSRLQILVDRYFKETVVSNVMPQKE